MKTSYRELDYESGKAIQALRNKIALTQAALAEHLGVSARAVREWETGGSYPKGEHLKELMALAVQSQVFPKGSEAQEIRALWKTTRQKWRLDEDWLSALLSQQSSQPSDVEPKAIEETGSGTPPPLPHAEAEPNKSHGDSALRPSDGSGSRPEADKTRKRRKRLLVSLIVLVILLIIGSAGTLFFVARNSATQVNKAAAYPGYLSGKGTLVFSDPLDQERGSKWRSSTTSYGSACQFTEGAYHVSQQLNNYFAWCPTNTIFSDFAFEVQLTITQGDCGGTLFHMESLVHYYSFYICQDGTIALYKKVSNGDSGIQALYNSSISAVHTDLGHQNTIAVVASDNMMTFYVNEQQIDQEQDSDYPSGKIALVAVPYADNGHATAVTYSNARLWTL